MFLLFVTIFWGLFLIQKGKRSTHALFQVFVTLANHIYTRSPACVPRNHAASPTRPFLAIQLKVLCLHLKISEVVLPPFWWTSRLVISPICCVINIPHNKIILWFIYTADIRIQENFCQNNFVMHWMIYFVNRRKHRLCVKIQSYVPLLEIFFSFILKKTKPKTQTKPPQKPQNITL